MELVRAFLKAVLLIWTLNKEKSTVQAFESSSSQFQSTADPVGSGEGSSAAVQGTSSTVVSGVNSRVN